MQNILHGFLNPDLFEASSALLQHLQIAFTPQTRSPLPFGELYAGACDSPMPKALAEAAGHIKATYFIGSIDEATLQGQGAPLSIADRRSDMQQGAYVGMLIFAIDLDTDFEATRTRLATLTRGFNRIA